MAYSDKELNDALLDAFDKGGLARVVRFQFSIELEQISTADNLTDVVFALTGWAAREGKTRELVKAMAAANPGNAKLHNVAVQMLNLPPRQTTAKLFHLQYARNPTFTGREAVLQTLREKLIAEGATGLTQAITGTGGVGKTQTAVEYCYRYRNDYGYVLWVNATDTATLDADFRTIATELGLPEKDNPEAQAVREGVKRHLRNAEGWLLVFDNADTPALLEAYQPGGTNGHILITTRDKRLRVLGITTPVVLDVWSREEAEAFFVASNLLAPNKPDELRDAEAVAADLGYLPLALEQAAAYMQNVRVTFAEYLTAFRARRLKMFEKEEAKPTQYEKTVAVTWQITIERIEQESKAAAELLRHCAFLAPDNIPWDIFRYGAPHLGPLLAEELKEVDLDISLLKELLAHCTRYSMLTYTDDDMAINIHRLVQEVIRADMEPEIQRLYVEHVTAALAASWQGGDYWFWPYLDMLLPHQQNCSQYIKRLDIKTELAGTMLSQAGYHLNSRGMYNLVEPFWLETMEIRRRVLPQRHPDIATSLNNLALLYERQGRYDAAEPLYLEALEIRRLALPDRHADFAGLLNNLAVLYKSQGRYDEAEMLFQQAVEIWREAVGENHPDYATSLNNLAGLHSSQGRYSEAEPLYKQVLEINQTAFGEEHPYVAASLNNLAALYRSQRRYFESEPLYLEALKMRRRILSEEHPDIAISLNNLGEFYISQGRYSEAIPLLNQALEMRQCVLPKRHPDIATTLITLAELYQSQGHSAEAEPLLKQALEIDRIALGESHPDYALDLNNLAELYASQRRYSEAEPLFQRALELLEKALPPNHPNLAIINGNMAIFYLNLGKMEKAIGFMQKVMAIQEAQEHQEE